MKKIFFLSLTFLVNIIITSQDQLLEFIYTPSSEQITDAAEELLRTVESKESWPDEYIPYHPLMVFIEEKKEIFLNKEFRPQTLFLKIRELADQYSSSRNIRKQCAIFLTLCFFQHDLHLLILLNKQSKKAEKKLVPSYEKKLDKKLKEIEEHYEKNRKEE